MATNYVVYTAKFNPDGPDDVVIDITTGTTLVGTNAVLNVNFDETVFTKAVGRKVLINAIEAVLNKLKQSNTTWPLTV